MQWRNQLKSFHAEVATQVLKKHQYDDATISKVCSLLKKENLNIDADMQTLEDVIVLAFLEHDLDEFVQKHSDYSDVNQRPIFSTNQRPILSTFSVG